MIVPQYLYYSVYHHIDRWMSYFKHENVVKYNKYYDVSYKYGSAEYKIRCKINRHRNSNIYKITDENENDITYLLIPYMGPMNNFHGKGYYPKDFNYKKITFHYLNNEVKIFEENDLIII